MATLFLHIGMHKTGTTALQKGFAAQRQELIKHGFVYHQDSTNSHNQNHFKFLASNGQISELEAMIRNSLENGPRADRHLISGEDISYMSDSNFFWLVDLLEDYFEDIRVIAGIRQPLSYMHSAAQEILKEPYTTISDLLLRPDVSPCYRVRFEKALLRVGRHKCMFVAYNNKIIHELSTIMKVPSIVPERTENKSMTAGVAILLNAAKLRLLSDDNPIDTFEGIDKLIQIFAGASEDHRKFEVPIEIVHKWHSDIQDDLKWLSNVWHCPSDFYSEKLPTASIDEFIA
jgi:hypothetical protein